MTISFSSELAKEIGINEAIIVNFLKMRLNKEQIINIGFYSSHELAGYLKNLKKLNVIDVQDDIIILNEIEENTIKVEKEVVEKALPYTKESKEILEFLNEQSGKRLMPVEANLKMIRSIINQSLKNNESLERTIINMKNVILLKCSQWKGATFNQKGENVDAEKYLTPKTLFSGNYFSKYLPEVERLKEKQNQEV